MADADLSEIVETLAGVDVEIEVVLGSAHMPVHQLLRMGRGAVIELEATEADDVLVLANDVPIAKAGIVVSDGRIGISITKLLRRPVSAGGDLRLEDAIAAGQREVVKIPLAEDNAPDASQSGPETPSE